MPITNEDIISSLVAYYKRTGVDMTALLGDPTWQSMKVYDKIEAIKKYAGEIHAGSSESLTPGEKKYYATSALLNAWPVLPAALTLGLKGSLRGVLPGLHASTVLKVGLGGAVIGVGVGSMLAYMQAKQALAHRQAVRDNLENVMKDPTTTNAIGVLSADNIHQRNTLTSNLILQRVRKEMEENFKPDEFVMDHYAEHAQNEIKHLNKTQPDINRPN
jgi:hypothetical protein